MVDFDVQLLAVLRELAERGSVTAVAAATHRTPSAVSQQLRTLQRQVGVPLVVRSGRGVHLTDDGRFLAALAVEVATAVEHVDAAWRDGPDSAPAQPAPEDMDLYPSATAGSGAFSGTSAPRGATVQGGGTYITPANWAPCAYKDEHKLVEEYVRVRATSGKHKTSGSVADLRCGTSSYGYFHILDGHSNDWQNMTYGTTSNWRDLADWAITWVLSDPDHKQFVPRNKKKGYKTDRWCYNRIVFLKDKKTGRTIETKNVFVIMGETGVRIITA